MRRFASVSPVSYNRKGDQVLTAPKSILNQSTLSSVKLATLDSKAPLSTISLVIGGGARHARAGISHLFSSLLIRNPQNDTITRTIREFEIRGDFLTTNSTREFTTISATFLKDNLVDIIPTILLHATNQRIYPYEFLHAIENINTYSDAVLSDAKAKVFEDLHRVAFRKGLGNSVYASSDTTSSSTRKDVLDFADKVLSRENIAVIGHNVDHADLSLVLSDSLSKFEIKEKSALVPSKTHYFGGNDYTHVADATGVYTVAFKSFGFNSFKESIVTLVIKSLLSGSSVYGSRGSLLKKAADIDVFNVTYSDAGLFGFTSSGEALSIAESIQGGIDALKQIAEGKFTSEDLASAKKSAIIDYESRTSSEVLSDLGVRILRGSKLGDSVVEIGVISKEDVIRVANLLLGSKPSVVAHGNMHELPYADELKF